ACFAASKASIIYLSSSVIQLSLFYVYIPMQMHIITIAFFSLKEELSLQIHVVQQGETLFSIARLYSTSIISIRSEEHTSELQSRFDLVCRLLLEKKKKTIITSHDNY